MVENRGIQRSFSWRTGMLMVVMAYILCLMLCYVLTGPIIKFIDMHFPFVFFYHLQEGEADGPIGDPMVLVTAMWIEILIFWVTFAPLALYLGVPRMALVMLTFFNEFMLIVIIPSFAHLLFGYV